MAKKPPTSSKSESQGDEPTQRDSSDREELELSSRNGVHTKGKNGTSHTNGAPSSHRPAPVAPTVPSLFLPFAIDMRSLAFFRLILGMIVIFDACQRIALFDMFYSTEGVWPLESHLAELNGDVVFSLFFACFHDYWQMFVFILTIVVAFLFSIGYRTSWTKWFLFVLVLSIQTRVLIGASCGDDLLIGCLIWSLGMPLGERWSVDAALMEDNAIPSKPSQQQEQFSAASGASSSSNLHLSLASVAFTLQPCLMYFFSAFQKTGHEWWGPEWSAMWFAWSGNDYARPFALWLRDTLPWQALQILTASSLLLEFTGPFLMLCPWRFKFIRTSTVIAFSLFHLGILLTLALGTFQYICFMVLFTLLPEGVWDCVEQGVKRILSNIVRTMMGEETIIPTVIHFPSPSSSAPLTHRLLQQEQAQFWRKISAIARYVGLVEIEVVEEESSLHQDVKVDGKLNGSASSIPQVSFYVLDHSSHPLTSHSAILAIVSSFLPFRVLRRLGLTVSAPGSLLGLCLLPFTSTILFLLRSPVLLSWFHCLLPWTTPSATGSADALQTRKPWRASALRNLLFGTLFVYVFVQNLCGLPMVQRAYPSAKQVTHSSFAYPAVFLKLDQRWAMFAPSPYKRLSWLVMRGRTIGRPVREVDVETLRLNSTVSFSFPRDLHNKYNDAFLFDWIDSMNGKESHYFPWAAYWCRKWNHEYAGQKANQLLELDLFFLSHNTTLPHEPIPPIEEELVWTQDCDEKYLTAGEAGSYQLDE